MGVLDVSVCVLVVCWVWQMVGAGQGCLLIDCSVFAWVWPVVVEDGGGWERGCV